MLFACYDAIIPNGVEIIDRGIFAGNPTTKISIPNSVTTIRPDSFMGCENLTSVTIPEGVTYMGYYVFAGCENLTDAYIPDSVTTIDKNAFLNCNKLTIHGVPGSCAEKYAKENNIPFVEL